MNKIRWFFRRLRVLPKINELKDLRNAAAHECRMSILCRDDRRAERLATIARKADRDIGKLEAWAGKAKGDRRCRSPLFAAFTSTNHHETLKRSKRENT